MEHRIRLLPSGHQFTALAQETLLEAALRSGININYNCSSGSCGDCHARLISGEIGASDFHDYSFSTADKAQRKLLLCTTHAATDLVIEAGEAKSTQDIPLQSISAKLSKVEAVSKHLRIIHLRTPRTRTLRFLAGQHVSLTLPDIGSIDAGVASCPCNGMQLQFHLPYDANSPFVREIFNGLRYGSEVVVDGPFGETTLDDDSPRPILMVAQEYGFAPIKSLIEHAINLDVTQPVRLFWLAKEHYMVNYCRSWGEALDDYRFIPLLQENGEDKIQAAQVFHAVNEEFPALAKWDIYYAGTPVFINALERRFLDAGADASRLFALHRRSVLRQVSEAGIG